MIPKSIIDQAKAFLCWDIFPDLTIQLVEQKETVSYFYPPFSRSTIIVNYERGISDFSIPLFHLFHEVGHYLQFNESQEKGRESDFWKIVNTPTGSLKVIFEKESWAKGGKLLEEFILKNRIEKSLLKNYDNYARKSIESYC